MKIEIKISNTYIDITNNINGLIQEDLRLDEALDSATFSFITKEVRFSKNIAPLTPCKITDDNGVVTFWLCSSKMHKIGTNNIYSHQVDLIETVKYLQYLYIGSKAFSVIEGKENYNQSKDRLRILADLVYENSGIKIDTTMCNNLTEVRKYQFEAGYYFFDCCLEIMKNEGCLPVLLEGSGSYDYALSYKNIESLESNQAIHLQDYIELNMEQSSEDYCENIITEMPEVIDRDTIQTVILSCRSTEDYIITDNACLVLPEKIEQVVSLHIKLPGNTAPCLKLPVSRTNNLSDIYNKDIILTADSKKWIDDYISNTSLANKIKSWIDSYNAGYDEFIVSKRGNFIYLSLWNSKDWESITVDDWTSVGVLNKKNWDLLEVDLQPAYIYFEEDRNTISGFYNTKDSAFMSKYMFGEKGPFFKNLALTPAFESDLKTKYIRADLYVDFEDKAKSLSNYSDVLYNDRYHILYLGSNKKVLDSYSPLDYIYKVRYIPKSPIMASEKKSITPSNESKWKVSAKSYNNGSSVIDYNQLVPAMRKSVNMLGLVQTTISTIYNYKVGTRLDKGYIITKRSIYRIVSGHKVIQSYIYGLCDNFQQIASAIGIRTQYEATNVPKTGLIDRFILLEATLSLGKNKQSDAMLMLEVNPVGTTTFLYKGCTLMETNNMTYISCSTIDNFTFDTSKEPGSGAYNKNQPASYANTDGYQHSYNFQIGYFPDEVSLSVLNALPYISDWIRPIVRNNFVSLGTKIVHKDPRERLIFIIKPTESGQKPVSPTKGQNPKITGSLEQDSTGAFDYLSFQIENLNGFSVEANIEVYCDNRLYDMYVTEIRAGYGYRNGYEVQSRNCRIRVTFKSPRLNEDLVASLNITR